VENLPRRDIMQKPFKKITFKNGLRVLLVPQKGTLAASVVILVEAGSEYEKKPVNGVSHFLEHMTFKGTPRRPRVGQIAEEFAGLGAQSNAFTGQEYTGYWAKAEAHKLSQILDIVSDLYLNPLFNPEDIEKERGVIIEEINMYDDVPKAKVQEDLAALMYGDQPAGWSIAGEKETIRKLMKDDFLKYRAARYIPKGTLVIVAGKFSEAAVVRDIEHSFGGLKRAVAPAKIKTKEHQEAPAIFTRFKESEQSHVAFGFRAFSLFDRRRHALQVFADVLGGGMSSRLFKRVRDELGAAYYVGADADLFLDHGVLGISAGIDHGKTEIVVRAILEECRKMCDTLVPKAEFERAKEHMIGNLVLGLETSDELASFYGGQEIMTRKIVSPETVIAKIRAVSPAAVRSVAREVLRNDRLNFAVMGPYKDKKEFENVITL
jgi:predicted Zn-dependent peptidase